MLTQGDLIYLQKPHQTQKRVLLPMDVVAHEQDKSIIETTGLLDWLNEEGQVLVYFDRGREFMKQSAFMELVIDDEEQVDSVKRYAIKLQGESVSADSRQCYRVSTVISGRTAVFADEGEVPLVDVSASGFAVISTQALNIGQVVKTTFKHEGREFSGTACVQSICELDAERLRYGMYCVEKRQPGHNLNQGLLTISMAAQREQLRRLSRAS